MGNCKGIVAVFFGFDWRDSAWFGDLGCVASQWSVDVAIVASGVALLLTPILGILLPLPQANLADVELVELGNEPEVGMAVTLRSGPVVIELDYNVEPAQAREFYDAMLKVQRTRLRNGGFNWSISRDIANPSIWTERFQCPTWGDYLRMRDRFTQSDIDLHDQARSFHSAEGGLLIRRKLERPFGSVRWKADTPDHQQATIDYIGP